ncbi:uncharacterized protein LOC131157513 [Malania oleifera]|uniref:uncharacterized protein LOC131157513 n=1 Tax=Malania oleifera TaxID=397392 RepID=UPI0025AEA73F|nr:uncharacterized protein LOC131157513 [Malania oleifera]
MLMCNKGIACPSESFLHSDNPIYREQPYQSLLEMDSPSSALASAPSSNPGSNDENPRVKFLCSFSGSIMPRPQDGKLRYVGGETRIVSLPRDVSYEELMVRMRELYDGATLLKYQQPDEDLDALVSVVNDDDVTNMMEEYDKLGSGDGFTRLRIFLFSHPDQDASSHFIDADERDSERRYVDALNSLNDVSDFRKQQQTESSIMSSVDEVHMAEQFFNQVSLEGSIHNQRNCEMPILQYNLRHLTIPHMGSGQHQQSVSQRYNEMEAPWSPAYYSPRHQGHHDPRPLPEFPSSPSSARFRMPFGELSDKMPEEYTRQQVNQQSQYDHPPQFSENVVWLPSGPVSGDKAGFPGNILHGPHGSNVFDGNSICEHCRMTFQRNQGYPDSHWKHGGEHIPLEQSNMGNVHQATNSCAECPSNRESFLNTDPKLHHGIYSKEQNDPRSVYNETHSHERGWVLQQLNPRAEEARAHISGAGRLADHYVVDGPGMTFPLGHGNLSDGHHVSSNYVHHEDPRYIRAGPEPGSEVFRDPVVASGSHISIPHEEHGVRYGNMPYAYGTDNILQVSHGHVPAHALWRNVQNPMHGAPYEASNSSQQANGTVNSGLLRGTVEGSPRFCIGVDNQNPWVESSPKIVGFDGSAVPEYSYGHALKLNPGTLGQGNKHPFGPDPIQSQTDLINLVPSAEPIQRPNLSSTQIDDKLVSSTVSGYNLESKTDVNITEAVKRGDKTIFAEAKGTKHVETFGGTHMPNSSCLRRDEMSDNKSGVESLDPVNSNCLRLPEGRRDVMKLDECDHSASVENSKLSDNHLSVIPELIASVKRAALEGVEEGGAQVQENPDAVPLEVSATKEVAALDEIETSNTNGESELDSENDNLDTSKIEPTKAEEEAIAKGLQTIKNDDLEEIRELGSGTYGAVYHGKWKGSDVAIKRIKASCFAGRPSERERLIADFWKEALILSSLHHPNVVSFYGIVRDGPDGSLATVTEFMVNGSLKQFLQKKDRTIDRRKRLIIAMDAAFGMEYLHGKNIVHFDLKCENLLVNMRDPHRPVCKIGDLGLSKVKQHTLVSGGVRGTLPWMAPELLSGKSNMVTEKIDVYSFGIVMWELLTGEEPYADMHCASIIGGIVNNTLRPQIPSWCDPEWKSLMESSWASEPAERPSFSAISQKLRSMAAAMNVR